MKKAITVLTLLLVLISCNKEASFEDILQSGDLEKMKSYRDGLESQLADLNSQINQLDKAISVADTSKGKYIFVETQTVVDSAFHHMIEVNANIESKQDVQITPEYSGVISVRVAEGQYVGKGTLLATISDGGLRDQLNQAQIQVDMARSQLKQAEIQRDLAQTTYQKQAHLWNQKIGSEMQYLQAKTSYETAQKGVEVARQQISAAQRGVDGIRKNLQKTNLYAPFGGVVETIITKSGQVVSPGSPVMRIVNGNLLRVVGEVPEQYLEDIKRGTPAEVDILSLDKKIKGNVSLVSAAINPNNRSFKVEVPIDSDNGMIKPNLNAKLFLNDYTNENAIIIPESAIKTNANGEYVFIVENMGSDRMGRAKKVNIETSDNTNGLVEVTSGLHNNDILILETQNNISEGDLVKVAK